MTSTPVTTAAQGRRRAARGECPQLVQYVLYGGVGLDFCTLPFGHEGAHIVESVVLRKLADTDPPRPPHAHRCRCSSIPCPHDV